jgi:hypothetical protein
VCKYLTFFIILLSYNVYSIEPLKIINSSDDSFEFDSRKNYLNIDITRINIDKHNIPSGLDKLLGSKATYGIIYLEIEYNAKKNRIPVYSYTVKSRTDYSISSLGVSETISYPVMNDILIKNISPPKIKLHVRFWKDKASVKSIKDLFNLSGAGLVDAGFFNIALGLVEELWPAQDQSATVDLVLNEKNIKINKTIDYGIGNTKLLTIRLTSSPPHFEKKIETEAINDLGLKDLISYSHRIKAADSALLIQGVSPLIQELKEYSSYISTLNLNYSDKVLLLARSIEQWAPNALIGKIDAQNKRVQLTYEQYLGLWNADLETLKEFDNRVLDNLGGKRPCDSAPCNRLRNFLVTSYSGMPIEEFLLPTVRVYAKGAFNSYTKSDIEFLVHTNAEYDNFKRSNSTNNQWEAEFDAGKLPLNFNGSEYMNEKITLIFGEFIVDGIRDFYLCEVRISD